MSGLALCLLRKLPNSKMVRGTYYVDILRILVTKLLISLICGGEINKLQYKMPSILISSTDKLKSRNYFPRDMRNAYGRCIPVAFGHIEDDWLNALK